MAEMKTLLPFTALRNDLYARLECTCPSKLFENSDVAHLMKHSIQLAGYNDSYFFDTVNAAPREQACKCGRRYSVQWFRNGVDAFFIDPPTKPTSHNRKDGRENG